MGIVGQDLNAFLRTWTAYYLLPSPGGTTTAGLDALGLPEEFQAQDPDDTAFARFYEWASPTVPSSLGDPYECRLTAADLHRIASTA